MTHVITPENSDFHLTRRGLELMNANMLAALKKVTVVCERAYEDAKMAKQENLLHDADEVILSVYLAWGAVDAAIAAAESVGIRAQSFAERERDLLVANNTMEERARSAERWTRALVEDKNETTRAFVSQFIRMGRRMKMQRDALKAVLPLAREKLADMQTFDAAAEKHARDYDADATARGAAAVAEAEAVLGLV